MWYLSKPSFSVCLVSSIFAWYPAAKAQTAAEGKPDPCLASSEEKCLPASDLVGALDLGVPSTPLFTLLGAAPENILQVKTADEFAISILPEAVNALGQDSFSLGLEFNPGLLALPENATITDLYGRYNTARLLSGMSVAFSAVQTSGDAEFSQYGVGLSYIFDTKSPLFAFQDFEECIGSSDLEPDAIQNRIEERNRAVEAALLQAGVAPGDVVGISALIQAKVNTQTGTLRPEDVRAILAENSVPGDSDAIVQQVLAAQQRLFIDGIYIINQGAGTVQGCVDEVQRWNRPIYGVGLAGYLTDPNEGSDETGFGLWASASIPAPFAPERGQITGTVRYTENLVRSREVDGADISETVDGWGVGLRYTQRFGAGSAQVDKARPDFRGFIEAGFYEEDFSGINDQYWRAGIGGEARVAENLFLQFVVGDTFGSDIDRSEYLSAQLKWSFTRASVE